MLPQLYQTELLSECIIRWAIRELTKYTKDLWSASRAWNEEGMWEMGNSMPVMPTGQRSKEIAISFAVDRVIWIQWGGADWLPEIMYDRQWLQSGLGHDIPIHGICRGRALHNCPSRRDVRSYKQYVGSETWLSDDGQSDNGTAFVGELTRELMRRSQVAQAHSTTYQPQTNGLVERHNRTLASMPRVDSSRYMTDWDRYLSQVMGAYNTPPPELVHTWC